MSALTLANNEYDYLDTPLGSVPRIFDEFWTAKQRQMHSLHYSNSYRASFKHELPDFYIIKFTKKAMWWVTHLADAERQLCKPL